jgi:hypothetical protein
MSIYCSIITHHTIHIQLCEFGPPTKRKKKKKKITPSRMAILDWGCGSVKEHSPRIHKALNSIPNTTKRKSGHSNHHIYSTETPKSVEQKTQNCYGLSCFTSLVPFRGEDMNWSMKDKYLGYIRPGNVKGQLIHLVPNQKQTKEEARRISEGQPGLHSKN